MIAPSLIKFTTSSALNELQNAIQSVIQEGAQSILLLTCSNNNYDEQQLNLILTSLPLTICGGIFPKVIYQEKSYSEGAIVIGLMVKPEIVNYAQLTSAHANLRTYIQDNSKHIECYQNFIIIADALCDASEDFTDEFYDYIGSDTTTIGGGAGSLDFTHQPVIYSNEGLIGEAVQVIALPASITKGMSHGWEVLDGPYLVTASEGHYVHSLNYKPTFELYRDAIKKNTNQTITEAQFFKVAKNFPFGIMSLNNELLVRDPIQTNGSYLECVGNVHLHSMVYLLKGELDKMVCASKETAQCVAKQGQTNNLLLFDCISRDLLMGDAIQSELHVMQQAFPTTCLIGVMALGEITNGASGSIRLLNKSTVLGAF